MLTFELVGRSLQNLLHNIRAAGATGHYAQKPEIQKNKMASGAISDLYADLNN